MKTKVFKDLSQFLYKRYQKFQKRDYCKNGKIAPFPLMGFTGALATYLKAQLSFSSGFPEDVTSMASRNSLKSMNPFLSVSKVRKT